MSDSNATAAAAENPSTEVPKTESSTQSNGTAISSNAAPEKSDSTGERVWDIDSKPRAKSARHSDDYDDRKDRDGHYKRPNGNRSGGRGRGGQNRTHYRRNKEFENLPESEDPSEILAQVEFYFARPNLRTDEHLFMEIEGPNNRPVSIKHISEFKRMRHFRPYSAIVAALRNSEDLVVVDDGAFAGPGNEGVKRKVPIVIEAQDGDDKKSPSLRTLFWRFKQLSTNTLENCIYVKGFENDNDAGQIALEDFFRPYGSVMVRKRRDDRNVWKGSIFVEFDSPESKEQFLALEPTPKFNGIELTAMGKKEYITMKCKEKGIKPDWELTEAEREEKQRAHREDRGSRDHRFSYGGGGRGRAGYKHRDNSDRHRNHRGRDDGASIDKNDWKNRRNRFQDGKDDRGSSNQDVDLDTHGVPVVRDTRSDAEVAASNKRKAETEERADSPKKSKAEGKDE